jgi:hypothetical protein
MQVVPAFSAADVVSITTGISEPLELRIGRDQGSRIAYLTISEGRELAYAILVEAERRDRTSN